MDRCTLSDVKFSLALDNFIRNYFVNLSIVTSNLLNKKYNDFLCIVYDEYYNLSKDDYIDRKISQLDSFKLKYTTVLNRDLVIDETLDRLKSFDFDISCAEKSIDRLFDLYESFIDFIDLNIKHDLQCIESRVDLSGVYNFNCVEGVLFYGDTFYIKYNGDDKTIIVKNEYFNLLKVFNF